jgi:hypothetical protein
VKVGAGLTGDLVETYADAIPEGGNDSLCELYVGAPCAHSRAGPFWQTVRCLYACVRFTTSRPCEITASGFFQFCTVSVGSFWNSTMSAHLPSPIAPMSSRCR